MREKLFSIICAFSLLLNSVFPVLSVSAVYAEDSTESATVASEPIPSPTPESTPESTPAITPSPTPEISPELSESPVPTTQPENIPSPSPTENIGQPNAPPDESPSPSPTSEPSPSVIATQTAKGHISAVILENTDAQSLQLDLTTQDVSSASLTTDKADYAPTDTAVIAGSDFPKETQLKLIITASNYRFETELKTDENGSFIYSYQLDGTYRPLYNVEAQDLSGLVLATTSFTDTDVPYSKANYDLKAMNKNSGTYENGNPCGGGSDCYAEGENVPFQLEISRIEAGRCTTNCSVLIQHDHIDGGITGYTDFNSPTIINGSSPLLTLSGTCGSSDTTCTYIFSFTTTNSDTTLRWNGLLSDQAGGWSGASLHARVTEGLVNGSDRENVGNQDIAINPNQLVILGSITPIKSTTNGANPSDWTFNISGNTNVNGVTSGSTATNLALGSNNSNATYTITEVGPAGWVLDSVSAPCTKTGDQTATVVLSGSSPDATCTFTNRQLQGGLTVIKHVVGGTAVASQWTMHVNQGGSSDVVPSFSGSESPGTTVNLLPGIYTVTESSGPSGYTLSYSENCSDGNITVVAGQIATCTLTNTRDTGTIELKKVWSGTAGQTTLNIGTSAGGTQTASQLTGAAGTVPLTTGTQTVNTGTYFVSETGGLTDYNSSLACTDDGSPVTPGTDNSLSVATGHTIICTFTNTRNTGTLRVLKNVDLNGDGDYTDANETGATDWLWQANAGADHNTGDPAITVNTGNYALTETSKTDFHQVSLSCTGGTLTGNSVSVTSGANVVCTFTNAHDTGTIELKKAWSGTGGQTTLNIGTTVGGSEVDTQLTGVGGASPLTTGQNTVNTGTYNVSESGGLADYSSVLSCYNDANNNGANDSESTIAPDGSNNVIVTTGQHVICTFTNTRNIGTIELKKVWSGTAGQTTLQIGTTANGNNVASTLSGASGGAPLTTGVKTVDTGTYYVSETGGLTNYDSLLSCTDDGSPVTPGTNNSLTVAKNHTVVCTFTNTRKQGKIELQKDFVGTTENVTIKIGTNQGGSQVDSDILSADGTDGEHSVDTGNYFVSETLTAPVNYTTGLVCYNDLDNSNTVSGGDTAHAVNTGTGEVSVGEGDDVLCVFTNTRNTGTLQVFKNVDLNGDADYSDPNESGAIDWTWDIAGGDQDIATGQSKTLNTGSYTISEDPKTNYHLVDWSCSDETSGTTNSILANVIKGTTLTCTFFNARDTGTIKVVKDVVPNDSGATGWDFAISGSTANNASDLQDGEESIAFTSVTGSYTVTESAYSGTTAGNYNTTYSCADNTGVLVSGSSVTTSSFNLASNKNIICTFTNTKLPKLTVTKIVTNHGGNKTSADFAPYKVDSTTVTLDTPTVFGIGSHTVNETTDSSYTATFSGDCDTNGAVTLAAGDNKTCTITNEEKPAKVIVHKTVINYGLTNDASHFAPYKVGGTTVTLDAETVMDSGSYVVSEAADSSYTSSFTSGDCDANGNIALTPGTTKTCTITNEENQATIVVHKVVENHGLTSTAADFAPYKVGNTTVILDAVTNINSGTYTVSESTDSNYAAAFSGDCDAQGQVVITPGSAKSCTITNEEKLADITVHKEVINHGGSKIAADFGPYKVGLITVTLDQATTFDSGSYTVAETPSSDYTATFSGDCNLSGVISLGSDEHKTCTITNEEKPAKLTVTKVVINDNGGTKNFSEFPLFVDQTGVTSGETNTFDSGSYVVSETNQPGYSGSIGGDCDTDGNVTLVAGQTKNCTITNDDNAPGLHLRKTITGDNGGTAPITDWTLTAAGTGGSPTNLSGTTPVDSGSNFKADTYALAEVNGPSGYTAGAWDCGNATMPDATHVTIPLGTDVTCTINNNDNAPSLTLNKVVVNDSGGTALASGWSLYASMDSVGIGGTGPTVSSDSTFSAGTYTLSETGPSGYSPSGWVCVGGSQSGDQITLGLGQSATCTITNDDNAPSLTLNKIVVNNDGGSAVESAWTLSADGPTPISGPGAAGSADVVSNSSFDAGTYTLSESTGPSGYSASSWTCTNGITVNGSNQITIGLGQSTVCTITNDDQSANLIVIKHVVNDNGGTAAASAFTMHINGTSVGTGVSFPGAESPGINTTVKAGSFAVTEDSAAGYSSSTSEDCSGTISNGATKTCTITNDDNAPSLTLNKILVKDNGGTALESDWTLAADGGTAGTLSGPGAAGSTDVVSGPTFQAGTYTLSESGGPTGYTDSAWSCVKNNGNPVTGSSITLGLGDSATCTITNDDNSPSLTLVKVVDNNDGGTATTDQWTLTAIGPTGFSGLGPSVSNGASFDAGTYTLSESAALTGYTNGTSWVCEGGTQGDGTHITVALGQSATCTIHNSDNTTTLKLTKVVTNNDGGTAQSVDYTLSATAANPNEGRNFSDAGNSSTPHNIFAGVNYTLAENPNPGTGYSSTGIWSCPGGTLTGDNVVSIPLGADVTCTVTNTDNNPQLKLVKVVANNNGGSTTAHGYTLSATTATGGFTDRNFSNLGDEGSFQSVYAGKNYVLAENPNPGTGYTASTWNCDGGTLDGSTISVPLGAIVTCTITNNDNAPSLTLNKVVVKNNGGTEPESAWTLTATGPTTISGSGTAGSADVVSGADFKTGTYTLSESTGPLGYTASPWSCVKNGGDPITGSSITLDLGDTATCTITNDDEPGKISGKKFNDLNGNHTEDTEEPGLENWTITLDKQNDSNPPVCISGTPVGELCVTTTNSFGNYAFNGLEPGTYIVSEVSQTGWLQTKPADGTYILIIGSGTEIDDRDFGNQGRGTIKINKIVSPSDETEWDFRVIGERDYDLIRHLGDGESTTLTDVPAANYTITETTDSNYTTTIDCGENGSVTNNAIDFAVSPGEDVECTFTNTRNVGSLQVNKELDSDGEWDGEFDNDEANDLGFRWGIDSETPEHLMGDTASPLPTGTYSVSENDIAGYTFTGWYDNNSDFGSCDEPEEETLPESINVSTDNQSSITLCNVRDTGRIIIQKLIDEDGDLQTTDDRTPGVDWVMDVDGTGQDTSDPSLPTTDGNGETQTDNIKTGEYTAVEGSKEGYHIVLASCSAGEESSRGTFDGTDSVDGIQVGKDETVNCTFINTQNDGTITILKNIDNNGDGDSNDEEDVRNAQNWTYDIAEGDQDNPMGGEKSLARGSYTISEDEQAGYKLLGWSCSNEQTGTANSIEVNVRNGSQTTCTFENQILPPVLTLTKANNKTGVDVSAGANVLYTLTVTLTGSPLSGVTLIDLPPAGFKYRSGSFTASSNFNPGLVVSEPTYASPGTWNLGNMQTGETVTLTYIADIDATTDPGLYKDLAWSKGVGLSSSTVLANEESGFFVGTQVNVVKNIGDSTGVEVERKERGEVLGISTSLPATGVNTIWVVLAALLIAGGAGLMWQGMNLRRKYE